MHHSRKAQGMIHVAGLVDELAVQHLALTTPIAAQALFNTLNQTAGNFVHF